LRSAGLVVEGLVEGLGLVVDCLLTVVVVWGVEGIARGIAGLASSTSKRPRPAARSTDSPSGRSSVALPAKAPTSAGNLMLRHLLWKMVVAVGIH